MSPLEIFGFVTGALSVWLAVRENVWNWWVGIANNVTYVVVFAQSRLFADASLQVVYVAISVYGIVRWLHGGSGGSASPVRRVPRAEAAALGAGGIVATVAMSIYLARVNDAAPALDAFTTVFSLIAQYGLARKYLENWWVWIVVDAVSIGLYAWKGLGLTAVLYAIFLAMCVAGALRWQRDLALAV